MPAGTQLITIETFVEPVQELSTEQFAERHEHPFLVEQTGTNGNQHAEGGFQFETV